MHYAPRDECVRMQSELDEGENHRPMMVNGRGGAVKNEDCNRLTLRPGRMKTDAEIVQIEQHVAEAYAAEAGAPGVEVHADPDITWVVHCGSAWRNSAVLVRLSSSTAARRLTTIIKRYERHGRGVGFWISPLATPARLAELLSSRGLHCRKRFPAMLRDVGSEDIPSSSPAGIEIREISDAETATRLVGSPKTPRGRCEVGRLHARLADPRRRTRLFGATLEGRIVGHLELFVGSACGGIHGITVDESMQGRGIGSALLDRACQAAAAAGSAQVVLLATTEGERLYTRRGFREVARFGYRTAVSSANPSHCPHTVDSRCPPPSNRPPPLSGVRARFSATAVGKSSSDPRRADLRRPRGHDRLWSRGAGPPTEPVL